MKRLQRSLLSEDNSARILFAFSSSTASFLSDILSEDPQHSFKQPEGPDLAIPPANFSILDLTCQLRSLRAAAKVVINRSGVPLLSLAALIYPPNLFTKQSIGPAALMFPLMLSTPAGLLKNRPELSLCVVNKALLGPLSTARDECDCNSGWGAFVSCICHDQCEDNTVWQE